MTRISRRGLSGMLAQAFIGSRVTPLLVTGSVLLGFLAMLVLPREEEPQIKVPVFDEFCHLEILLGDSSYWLRGLFWQHNEHRIPLPRAVYWLLMKATAFNFKSPCFFNAACLTLATLVLLATVRRLRGRAPLQPRRAASCRARHHAIARTRRAR